MKIEHDNPRVCSIKFEKQDWDSGLAYRVNDAIKKLETKRWFDGESKCWKVVKQNGALTEIFKIRDEFNRKYKEVEDDGWLEKTFGK